MTTPLFLLSNVWKKFPYHPHAFRSSQTENKEKAVLEGINLNIYKGEKIAVMGPNGAGKTTFLRVLAGILESDEGEIKIEGKLIQNNRHLSTSIGLGLGDERSFYRRLTGRENLEFFAALFKISKNQSQDQIKRFISVFDLQEIDKPYQEYSSGMRQRLSIARSLLHNPSVLLLDEPTKSLDPEHRAAVHEWLKKEFLSPDKTLLLTTHHMDEALNLCNRMLVLHQGKIVLDQPMDEIKKQSDLYKTPLDHLYQKWITHGNH